MNYEIVMWSSAPFYFNSVLFKGVSPISPTILLRIALKKGCYQDSYVRYSFTFMIHDDSLKSPITNKNDLSKHHNSLANESPCNLLGTKFSKI
jgi:hypothetical protein